MSKIFSRARFSETLMFPHRFAYWASLFTPFFCLIRSSADQPSFKSDPVPRKFSPLTPEVTVKFSPFFFPASQSPLKRASMIRHFLSLPPVLISVPHAPKQDLDVEAIWSFNPPIRPPPSLVASFLLPGAMSISISLV